MKTQVKQGLRDSLQTLTSSWSLMVHLDVINPGCRNLSIF